MENTENAAPPTGPRTAAATAARKRQREEAAATLLVERGWKVETPDGTDWRPPHLFPRRARRDLAS